METRITGVYDAWRKMRPRKVFYGMTFKEFEVHVKRYRDAVAAVAGLKIRMKEALWTRDAQAAETMNLVKGVVAAVLGDRNEGEDGELYSAMGYIPKSQRKSGLRRPRRRDARAGNSGTG